MTNLELKQKLEQAQALLSDVYFYAIANGMPELESQMSCADSCIIDSLDNLE
jgi:hypothetical protein